MSGVSDALRERQQNDFDIRVLEERLARARASVAADRERALERAGKAPPRYDLGRPRELAASIDVQIDQILQKFGDRRREALAVV